MLWNLKLGMFIRPPVGNMAACTQPRHVYVDLGVNWIADAKRGRSTIGVSERV